MISSELSKIAETLKPYINQESKEIEALVKSANEIAKSWSGSFLGYHACVYYNGFTVPPPRYGFDLEWGLMDRIAYVERGNWRELKFDDVVSYIYQKANNPSLDTIIELSKKAAKVFEQTKTLALSKLYASGVTKNTNEFLKKLIDKVNDLFILSKNDLIKCQYPQGSVISRDSRAFSQGFKVPPHLDVFCEVKAIQNPFCSCARLMELIVNLGKHLKYIENLNSSKKKVKTSISSKKVFIVHGHDELMKTEVARFIEKFGLEAIILHEQVNAGLTIIEKIEKYSDVGFGVILYSPCDKGGVNKEKELLNPRARQNVVFEHGYLTAKLGRSNVAVLLKDNVEKPGDSDGIVYISYDTSNWQISLAKELQSAKYDIDLNAI